MMLSEIIRRFQGEMEQHGDMPVFACTGMHLFREANVRVTHVDDRIPLCYDIEINYDGPEIKIAIGDRRGE